MSCLSVHLSSAADDLSRVDNAFFETAGVIARENGQEITQVSGGIVSWACTSRPKDTIRACHIGYQSGQIARNHWQNGTSPCLNRTSL
jgi:hypothetical protein